MEDYEDYEDDLEGFEDSERSRTRFDLFAGKSLSLARATFHISYFYRSARFLISGGESYFEMERQNLKDFEDEADKFRSIVIAEIESSAWLITMH